MTRHIIEHGRYCIIVGWDRPLDTFYATVEDDLDEDAEDPLIYMGNLPGEFRDVDTFKRAFNKEMKRVGIEDFQLSDTIKRQLTQDRDENAPGFGTADKTVQMRQFLEIFRNLDNDGK